MQLTQKNGYYGEFGGCFLPEILMDPIRELSAVWDSLKEDIAFRAELTQVLQTYAGRPTPLTAVPNFAAAINTSAVARVL